MTQTIIHVPASEGGGAFDPTDIEITDNTSGAFLVKEGSNEYMRIDTTNGSELTQFKMPFTTGEFKLMQETSAGSYPFIKCDATSARLFPGADGGGFNFNRVEVTTSHVHLTGSGSEVRIGASLPVSGSGVRAFPAAGHSWTELLTTGSTSKIQRVSDGYKMLEVDIDCNATFQLDDASAGVFKVTNDSESYDYLNINEANNRTTIQTGTTNTDYIILKAGGYEAFRVDGLTNVLVNMNPNVGPNFKVQASSNEYINVETQAGSESTSIKGGSTQGITVSGNSRTDLVTGSQTSASDVRVINSGGTQIARIQGNHDINLRAANFKIADSATNTTYLQTDVNTNFTHTLDSSGTCNFKVVDDAASPVTYLDIERGSTEKVKIPVVGLQTIRAVGSTYVLGIGNTNGVTFHTYAPNFQNHVPADLDQTDDGTTVALGYRVGATVTYGASASAAATTGITLTMQAGLVADGSTSTQHLVLHNQNATHSAKFILDGSAQYAGNAVATAGTDAADLVGSGFTLAAGKLAVFSIIGCRVENPSHYFYCVSLHTKT